MKIWGAVEGGYSLKARRFSAEQTAAKRELAGFVIDGFHLNGDSATELEYTGEFREELLVEVRTFSTNLKLSPLITSLRTLVEEVLQRLPEEKPRLFPGAVNPVTALDLARTDRFPE